MALAVAPAMGPSCDAVVVGAGPVGLAAVLAAARRGRSLLVARRTPAAEPPRIDAVPAPFLALLLELGVHPDLLGVRRLHDTRLVAWERAEPEVIRGPATAHMKSTTLRPGYFLKTASAAIPGLMSEMTFCGKLATSFGCSSTTYIMSGFTGNGTAIMPGRSSCCGT